jgi:hypothetical protein
MLAELITPTMAATGTAAQFRATDEGHVSPGHAKQRASRANGGR